MKPVARAGPAVCSVRAGGPKAGGSMSVAGLKKQFYKASQVRGGRGRGTPAGQLGGRARARLGRGPSGRAMRVPCRAGESRTAGLRGGPRRGGSGSASVLEGGGQRSREEQDAPTGRPGCQGPFSPPSLPFKSGAGGGERGKKPSPEAVDPGFSPGSSGARRICVESKCFQNPPDGLMDRARS